MSILAITINDDGTYTKASGPDCATVADDGDINVSACTETIDIAWTYASGTFRTAAGGGVTISGNGNGQIFTGGALSNDNKTWTVTDGNPATLPPGAGYNFTYMPHPAQGGGADPSIRNRG